jgi:Adenylate and Guanylate cyclase catalytic domain
MLEKKGVSLNSLFTNKKKGDCYVAAAGLPLPASTPVEPAVRMARFARDCMREMEKLSAELEVSLVSSPPVDIGDIPHSIIQGPDTSSLSFRVGIHSGPVTGYVVNSYWARLLMLTSLLLR